MKEKIIKSYIKSISKDDIMIYAKKNNINLTNKELDIIYFEIKNNYNAIINNPNEALYNIKSKVSSNTYDKLYELYTIYYPKLYH